MRRARRQGWKLTPYCVIGMLSKNLKIPSAFVLALVLQMVFVLGATEANAAQAKTATSKFEQRKSYKRAIAAVKSGQRSKFKKMKPALADYTLYPYLEYFERIYQLSRQDNASIDLFLAQYADTPLAERLRQNWLYHQAKRGRWDNFLQYYKPVSATKVNTCHYAYALAKTGQTEAAFQQAEQRWSVGFSQPDECDAIFKIWRDAGQLTPDLAWKRFHLSMQAGKITLANYLVRFLNKQDAQHAARYLAVHRKPALIKKTRKYSTPGQRNMEIVSHGLKRLARRNAQGAYETMQNYRAALRFSEEESRELLLYIGYRLASQGDAKNSLERFPIAFNTDTKLVEARIRLALKRGDTGQVLVLMHQLPDRLRDIPRWRYWRARILQDSAQPAEQIQASNTLTELANTRNYYGFLAADHLGMPYQFENSAAGITEAEILKLESSPGIERALELYALGELTMARREWLNSVNQLSNKEQQIAAYVAQRWGWHKRAIQSMIDAEAWDDLNVRFPLAYQDSFVANALKADIPVTYGFAIARQESAFMPDAKSSAGALGLMQMIPSTAKMTARRHNLKFTHTNVLIDPHTNIKFGTAHLGTLLRRYNNNRILASVAYNAGPGRVQAWLDPKLPVDVWIETIPFTETRHYVQNVLMFAAIYGNRMKSSQALITPEERAAFPASSIAYRGVVTETVTGTRSD